MCFLCSVMKGILFLGLFFVLVGVGFVGAEVFTEPGTYEIQKGDAITFNDLTIQVIGIKTNDNNVSWNQDFGREMVYLSTPGLGFYCYVDEKIELNRAKYSDEKPIAVIVNSIDLENERATIEVINNLKEEGKEPICTDSDGGKNIYKFGNVDASNLDLNSDSDLAGENGKDFCLPRPELYGADLAEYYCQNNEAVKEFVSCPNGCSNGACEEEEIDYGSTEVCVIDDKTICQNSNVYWIDSCGNVSSLKEQCEQGCSAGACITGKQITEQITCYFGDSKVGQKCYLAGSFTNEDNGTKYCEGVGSCIIEFSGYEGQKITWKSTCGGYDYSIVDGTDNNIDFDCGEGEVNEEEIKNVWFRSAYWQCYDDEEQKSEDDTSCKSSETWQKYAKEFCKGHCYEEGSKCGVNSFSVSNECYPDLGKTEESVDESVETEASLICKNSCPLENKCYPFGYRKNGKYCSDKTNFVDYKGSEESCDNNFECSSNVCVNSECISVGFLRKIMNWFRRLFGG